MANLKGFWSYTHTDDDVDNDRISLLAKNLTEEYEMLTGEKIDLLIDQDIKWGENWGEKIDSSLASVVFFIPVLTPRYFLSPECRRELQFFSRRAKNIGIEKLILSLRYVDFPELTDENTEDPLIKLVQDYQWKDWTDLRFAEVNSEAYRRGVNNLALRLVDANRNLEEAKSTQRAYLEGSIDEVDVDDEGPGYIEALENTLNLLNDLPETLGIITDEINKIGRIMKESKEYINRVESQGKGYRNITAITIKTANELKDPTEIIFSKSNVYAFQIHEIDEGYRILINSAPMLIELNPDMRQSYCKLFDSIRTMADASIKSVEGARQMVKAVETLELMSRHLRPVGRRLKKALTIMIESTEVSKDWLELIDNTGVSCDDYEDDA